MITPSDYRYSLQLCTPEFANYRGQKALRIDVQTAMTVIGKRSVKVDEMHLDLSYTNLQDADLEKADLAHANLGGAYLEGAYGKPLVS